MEAAVTVTLIGLVRVTGDARDVEQQRGLLDPICARVLEERASRRRLIKNRPQLLAALDHLRSGDMLVVTKAKHLAHLLRFDHWLKGPGETLLADALRPARTNGAPAEAGAGAAAPLRDRPPPLAQTWLVPPST